jgi:diaminopropionate ammonia-lyase
MDLLLNPSAQHGPLQLHEQRVVSLQASREALEEMQRWPGYAITPLRSLRPLAQRLGLREISYKDESGRFSLGSFKALGGAYAAGCELRRRLRDRFGIDASLGQVYDGRYATQLKSFTLCCATDGNHGQSVAYAARRVGCSCVVFMHEHAPESKAAAIRRLGADVRRTRGTYDDSVSIARKEAAWDSTCILIADTSTAEFEQIPAEVIQGYAVMVHEVLQQLQGRPPSHVFVQGGVGGLAAAVAGTLTEAFGKRCPTLIVVEPTAAACLMESARRGKASHVGGDLRTNMEMLSCGMASPIAWTILSRRADAFLTIADEAAIDAVHRLSIGEAAGAPIDVGFSGAAGVAGLLDVMKRDSLREQLKLGADSHVLVFGTEAGERRA